jgi:hypothetical protein
MKFKNLTRILAEDFSKERSKLTVMPYDKLIIFENYLDKNFNGLLLTNNISTKLKIKLLKRHQDIFSRDFFLYLLIILP